MPDDEFKLRSSIWWMAAEFTERLKHDRETASDQVERMALERKWILLFVSRLVLERSFKRSAYQAELTKHYKGDWSLGQEKIGRWMQDIYDVSKEALVYKYSEDANRPAFNHRNWMRSTDTVASLREYVRRAPRVEVSAGL